MSFFSEIERIRDHVHELVTQAQEQGIAPTILLDGPSGSGKTTLSQELEQSWEFSDALKVVHMDDIYPGWNGLAQGVLVAGRMLRERSTGLDTRYQHYDWNTQSLTHWHTIPADVPLLLEGCGSLPQGAQHASQARIWLDAPGELRRERALSRVGENFAEHWSQWDDQFQEYVRIHNPQAQATLEIHITE